MQIFKLATDERPSSTEIYGDGSCGHQKIAAGENHCDSCLGDYEPPEEWQRCSRMEKM